MVNVILQSIRSVAILDLPSASNRMGSGHKLNTPASMSSEHAYKDAKDGQAEIYNRAERQKRGRRPVPPFWRS